MDVSNPSTSSLTGCTCRRQHHTNSAAGLTRGIVICAHARHWRSSMTHDRRPLLRAILADATGVDRRFVDVLATALALAPNAMDLPSEKIRLELLLPVGNVSADNGVFVVNVERGVDFRARVAAVDLRRRGVDNV